MLAKKAVESVFDEMHCQFLRDLCRTGTNESSPATKQNTRILRAGGHSENGDFWRDLYFRVCSFAFRDCDARV